jgi:hypothetical protein
VNHTATEIDIRIQEAMQARTLGQFAPGGVWKTFNPDPQTGFTVRRAANGVVFTFNGTDYVAADEIAASVIILDLIKKQLNPNYENQNR